MNINKLKSTLNKQSDINLAFLFGSYAEGNHTHDSDVDIAVLFGKDFDINRTVSLASDISDCLKPEVDIVVLNDASAILKMQVLEKGMLLLDRDKKQYNDFFVNTVNEYSDLKIILREAEENILKGKVHG